MDFGSNVCLRGKVLPKNFDRFSFVAITLLVCVSLIVCAAYNFSSDSRINLRKSPDPVLWLEPWPISLCSQCSLAGRFALTEPLPSQVYKWVLANLVLQ